MDTNRLSIKQAVVLSGLSENYIRKAISKGDLAVIKEPIGESKIKKNWIDAEVFEAWRAEAGAHSRREDGRNKFVLYMTEEEQAAFAKALKGAEFAGTLQRAYAKKATAETE
jgi:hypothetical protein